MTSRLLSGPVLVLQGRELAAVGWLVSRGIRAVQQRDGGALPPDLLDLARQIELAGGYAGKAVSVSGPRVADTAPGGGSSTPRVGGVDAAGQPGRLTSRQVAEALGVSVRHVTRNAGVLGGVKEARDWSFDPDVVNAYGALRAARRE